MAVIDTGRVVSLARSTVIPQGVPRVQNKARITWIDGHQFATETTVRLHIQQEGGPTSWEVGLVDSRPVLFSLGMDFVEEYTQHIDTPKLNILFLLEEAVEGTKAIDHKLLELGDGRPELLSIAREFRDVFAADAADNLELGTTRRFICEIPTNGNPSKTRTGQWHSSFKTGSRVKLQICKERE